MSPNEEIFFLSEGTPTRHRGEIQPPPAVSFVRNRAGTGGWKKVHFAHPETSMMVNVAFFGARVFVSSGKGKLWESLRRSPTGPSVPS